MSQLDWAEAKIERLKEKKRDLKRKNEVLTERVKELETRLLAAENAQNVQTRATDTNRDVLSNVEISRYGRQLIMPELGPAGQRKLKATSVLIVGAGGLGSPSSLYLAGAGIGRLGILDFDTVEESNLHRQVIHKESSVGVPKAVSAANAIRQFNSLVQVIPHVTALTSENALEILSQYDIIVDASDNVATRYLINDASVLLKKPLVSGAALRMEGQVTVYNYNGGPCYRCLYPQPPPPETVTDCANGGVLGVVPGIIGCMQALEVVKIASGVGNVLTQKLLLFDGMSPRYTMVKLRPRDVNCKVCGDEPSITQLIDYQGFCGSSYDDKPKTKSIIDASLSISCKELSEQIKKGEAGVILDVRENVQYEICSLQNSINIPLWDLKHSPEKITENLPDKSAKILCLCRRGNDSQSAVKYLQGQGFTNVYNVQGGLSQWSREIDNNFPTY